MKKAILVLAAAAAMLIGIPGSPQPVSAEEDLLQGAAGLAWKTTVADVPDLQESARSGDIRYYRRPGHAYRIDGITLPEIIYGFYQGRYFAAYINVSSPADVDQIRSYLEKRYGRPRAQLRTDRTIFIWDYPDAKIKLKQYRNQAGAKLAYYCVPLSRQANQSRGVKQRVKVYDLDEATPDYDF